MEDLKKQLYKMQRMQKYQYHLLLYTWGILIAIAIIADGVATGLVVAGAILLTQLFVGLSFKIREKARAEANK